MGRIVKRDGKNILKKRSRPDEEYKGRAELDQEACGDKPSP